MPSQTLTKKSSSPNRWSPPGCGVGIGEDPLWAGGPSDEEKLFAAEETWTGSGVFRTPEPGGALERLGEMISLLGPRYKTLQRERIWEKALEGELTPLQRKMKRLEGIPGADAGLPRVPKKMPVPPEDWPDMDTEAPTRATWLALRRQERERRDLSSPAR